MAASTQNSPSNTEVFNKFLSENTRTLTMLDERSHANFIQDAKTSMIEAAIKNKKFIPLEFAQNHPTTSGFDAFKKPRTATTQRDVNGASKLNQSQELQRQL